MIDTFAQSRYNARGREEGKNIEIIGDRSRRKIKIIGKTRLQGKKSEENPGIESYLHMPRKEGGKGWMDLSERLVAIRQQHGYTRKRLAEELGRPYTTITKYENGEREPGHAYIIEIAKKFHVTTDYILGIEPEKPVYKLSQDAIALAYGYTLLDAHGKKLMRLVLDSECQRCKREQEQEGNASPNPKDS